MAIITPGGLMVRVDPRFGFTLLARLWSRDAKTDSVLILRTCDGIEAVPGLVGYLCGLAIAFVPGGSPWLVMAGLAGATAIARLAVSSGMVILPLATVGVFWNFRFPFIIRQVTALAAMLILKDWRFALFWVLGSLASVAVELVVSMLSGFMRAASGIRFTDVEASFLRAYCMHARRLRISSNLEIDSAEAESEAWLECFEDYAEKMPPSAVRIVESDLRLALEHESQSS